MQEIEIKLQVPSGQRRMVEAAVKGRGGATRTRLQAAYYDTPERLLAQAGMALRMRREGRQWVQTLKGAGDDGLTRLEHNVPRGSAAAMPEIDPLLHVGNPAADRLQALLASVPDAGLRSLYRTDVQRLVRESSVRGAGRPGGRVEFAFDTGKILSGDSTVEICELEIELLSGSSLSVIDLARRWVPRHELWFDGRSKAERGDLLSRGQRMSPAREATELYMDESIDLAGAWQVVLRNCADQVLANASQIASGEHAPEHVHQLRVGLRRLRSAMALFDHPDEALSAGAEMLFRSLGAARDQAVTETEYGAELVEAMRRAGMPAEQIEGPPSPVPPSCAPLVRAAPSQVFLLDLLSAMHVQPPSATGVESARQVLEARLLRWHRQVAKGAKGYEELDDESRHRLRKRAKRLRYGVEFCAGFYAPKDLKRYLKGLKALQERLGEVSDVMMAMDVFRPRATTEPRAVFALGWLAARRDAILEKALPELKRFGKLKPLWKGAS